ncbi:MAG: hypothetical protein ACPL6D_05505 [Thermodesulfobacteriota bacterium]
MRKILEIFLTSIIIIITLNQLSFAGNRTTITVTAVVLPRIEQSIIHQESRIYIRDEDIEKGYLEVPSGTILQVKTNHRSGYMLYFEVGNEIFKEIMVMERGRVTVLSPNGGLIHQPYSGSNIEIKKFSYRLYLREGVKPGLYSWPLSVKATLL